MEGASFFRMANPSWAGGGADAVSLTRGDRAARPRSANVPLSRGTAGGDSPGGGTARGWWGQRVSRVEMGRQRTRTGAPRETGRVFSTRDAGRGVQDAPSGSGGVGVETVEPIGRAAVRASSASSVRPRDSTVPGEPAARPFVPFSRDESASSPSPANSFEVAFSRLPPHDASVCSDPDRARRAPARRRSAR